VPYFLRSGRTNRWYKDTSEYRWLQEGEVPAEPVGDFVAANNELSVWLVEDADDTERIERIAAMLINQKGNLSNFDYVLFDMEIVTQSLLESRKTQASTIDDEVNTWHHDIVELNTKKLCNLVEIIWKSDWIVKRISRKRMKRIFTEKYIDAIQNQQLSSKIIDELTK